MKEYIEIKDLEKFEKAFNERKDNYALQAGLINHGINSTAFNYSQNVKFYLLFKYFIKFLCRNYFFL